MADIAGTGYQDCLRRTTLLPAKQRLSDGRASNPQELDFNFHIGFDFAVCHWKASVALA